MSSLIFLTVLRYRFGGELVARTLYTKNGLVADKKVNSIRVPFVVKFAVVSRFLMTL